MGLTEPSKANLYLMKQGLGNFDSNLEPEDKTSLVGRVGRLVVLIEQVVAPFRGSSRIESWKEMVEFCKERFQVVNIFCWSLFRNF